MDVTKPLVWVGSSKRDLKRLPDDVKDSFGFALYLAQIGERAVSAKPFKGLSGVVELVENHDGDTYRAMYTARFGGVVYVLHAFQKSRRRASKHRNKTWTWYADACAKRKLCTRRSRERRTDNDRQEATGS